VATKSGNEVRASTYTPLFELSPEGVFTILDFSTSYYNYQVFLKADNGETSSDFEVVGTYLIDVTFFE